MRWKAIAAPELAQDLILFDSDCLLCSRSARFVLRRDAARRLHFVAVQSPYGRALARRFGIDPGAPETGLAIFDGGACLKSDAVLAVQGQLSAWRWTGAIKALPRPVRDWFYDRLARNRYAVFGRRAQCWIGDPDFAACIFAEGS